MTRRLAIFDLDGTLVDSRQPLYAAMRRAFARMGIDLDYDHFRVVIGLNMVESLNHLAPDLDEAGRTRLLTHIRESFTEAHAQPGYIEPLYEGAPELLTRLRQEGWLVAMATGKSRAGVEMITRMHNWGEVFHSSHCATDGPGKPDPAMLHAAMQCLKVEPSQVIMIGDTSHDMRMARNAGVYAQGVSWGFQTAEEVAEGKPHHIAHTFEELNASIDQFGAGVR
jgi:phosphoglycolate phosphatase